MSAAERPDRRGADQGRDDQGTEKSGTSLRTVVKPHHLQPDEHSREPVPEEMEPVHHAGQENVHRPETEDREDVGVKTISGLNQHVAAEQLDDRVAGPDPSQIPGAS
jgi:hypothetical protein